VKQNRYTVVFDGAVALTFNAGSIRDAVILACAERVKKGHHQRIFYVRDIDNNKEYAGVELVVKLGSIPLGA